MNGRIVLVERENLNSSHWFPLLSPGTKTPFGRQRDVGDLKREKDGMLAQKITENFRGKRTDQLGNAAANSFKTCVRVPRESSENGDTRDFYVPTPNTELHSETDITFYWLITLGHSYVLKPLSSIPYI